jgi:hypothetical protein
MLVFIDALGPLVTYSLVDITTMHVVLSRGDPYYVSLLPFVSAILPDRL